VFTIELLPAQRGDCLWITYGEPGDLHHVLVDGGPQETIPTLVPELEKRIATLPGRTNRIDLLVVTHVDADHIQGVVSLLSDPRRVPLFKDVWFNGWPHLHGLSATEEVLGAPDGERLTLALREHPTHWNRAFRGGPVEVPATGPLPVKELAGGLELTVLGPTRRALERLAPEWQRACAEAGIVPGHGTRIGTRSWQRADLLGFDINLLKQAPYRRDRSAPNGTSITLIARYAGRSVLLTGDAHAEELLLGLDRLSPGVHDFTAVKMSHHGSQRNTNSELCERIRSRQWLISTNGAVFGHPDNEALARVVASQQKPTFVLNYATEHVNDLVENAGDAYGVRLPRLRKNGTHAEGNLVRLA
jgi:hypothetical protein